MVLHAAAVVLWWIHRHTEAALQLLQQLSPAVERGACWEVVATHTAKASATSVWPRQRKRKKLAKFWTAGPVLNSHAAVLLFGGPGKHPSEPTGSSETTRHDLKRLDCHDSAGHAASAAGTMPEPMFFSFVRSGRNARAVWKVPRC